MQTRHDRTGPDGRQHRPPADEGGPSVRGLDTRAPKSRAEFARRARPRPRIARGPGRKARHGAARRLGRCCRPATSTEETVGAGRPAEARRHHHRRRQQLLQGRHPPGQGAEGQGHPLCRRRHLRRRLGPGARLLHDDRRRRRRRSSGSIRSSPPWRPAWATSRAPSGREAPIRAPSRAISTPARSGAGHFVKMVHNGIEYGLMQAYAEGFDILKDKAADGAARRRALRPQPGRHRRGLAARQRDLLLAARPDRPGAGRRPEARRVHRRRGRQRRGPLDHRGGDGGGGAGRRADRGALRPLPLARGPHLRREAALGHALRLRRPRRRAERQ